LSFLNSHEVAVGSLGVGTALEILVSGCFRRFYAKPLARKQWMEEIHLTGEDLQRKHA